MIITPSQRARAHIMSMPLSAVEHPSMGDLVNLVVLQSVPSRRNHSFEVAANCMNVNTHAHTHQSAFIFWHLQTFILLL